MARAPKEERVAIFDDERQAVSWKRDFGFGQLTDRWQIVEPEGNGSHYYTALKNPPPVAFFVDFTFAGRVRGAFRKFGEALRDEAERRAKTPR